MVALLPPVLYLAGVPVAMFFKKRPPKVTVRLYAAFFVVLLCSLVGARQAHAQKQGQELIDSFVRILPALPDDSNKVKILNKVSYEYTQTNTSEGIAYGQKALALAKKLGWKKGLADAYNSLGANYMFKAEYAGALQYAFEALKYYEELNDKVHMARLNGNIGIVYDQLNDSRKALGYYLKSLKMSLEAGDEPGIIASIQYNIGSAYMTLKEYDLALRYNNEALAFFKQTNNKDGEAEVLIVLSGVYKNLHQYATALECAFDALIINRQLGNVNGVAAAHGYIGSHYLAAAIDSAVRVPASKYIPASKNARLRLAALYADSCLALSEQLGDLDYLQDYSRVSYAAHRQLGNYEKALTSYELYLKYHDSVFSQNGKARIAQLETEREVLLKDKQIELRDKQLEIDRLAVAKKRNERVFFIGGIVLLLIVIFNVSRNVRVQKWLNVQLNDEKRKVEEKSAALQLANNELNVTLQNLEAAQDQLVETEKQKENEMIRSRISQDIHDDISSELTKMSWISALAKAKASKNDVEGVKPLLDKITAYSQQTVAKLGEIVWAVNPRNDTMDSLLAYMRNYVAKFLADTPFQYTVDFPELEQDVHLNPELKRNLFLVMKEALHNSVKYSQARHITVRCIITGDQYTFTFADDGRGVEDGKIEGGGNGLINMKVRAQAVDAAYHISSAPGKGTTIQVSGTIY